MIYNLDREDSPIERMLDMVARHGPRLMREGGGPLMGECLNSGRRASPETIAMFRKMSAEGLSGAAISRATGWSQNAVAKQLRKPFPKKSDAVTDTTHGKQEHD